MDSKFYWILNNLVALLNLTECGGRYSIFSLDFINKRIGVIGARELAKDLGVEDRLTYRPDVTNDKIERAQFDYHGVEIFDLITKRKEENTDDNQAVL